MITRRVALRSAKDTLKRFYVLRRGQKIDEDIDLGEHYEELLLQKNYDKKGMMTVDPTDLRKMIRMSNTPEDIETCLKAYYNFSGHNFIFDNKDVDEFMMKAAELGASKHMLDVLEHHQYLMYYPHPIATAKILENLSEVGESEDFERVLSIFKKNTFIKLDQGAMEGVQGCLSKIENEELSQEVEELTQRLQEQVTQQ